MLKRLLNAILFIEGFYFLCLSLQGFLSLFLYMIFALLIRIFLLSEYLDPKL